MKNDEPKNNHMFTSKTSRLQPIEVKKLQPQAVHLIKEEFVRNQKHIEKNIQEAELKRTRDFKQRVYKSNLSFETASLEYTDEIKQKLINRINSNNIAASNSQKQFVIKIVEATPKLATQMIEIGQY